MSMRLLKAMQLRAKNSSLYGIDEKGQWKKMVCHQPLFRCGCLVQIVTASTHSQKAEFQGPGEMSAGPWTFSSYDILRKTPVYNKEYQSFSSLL